MSENATAIPTYTYPSYELREYLRREVAILGSEQNPMNFYNLLIHRDEIR